MAQFVVPNAVQIKLRWTMQGIPTLNVLGATAAGAPTVNQALADALDTAIKAGYTSSGLAAICSTATILTSVGVRSVHAANLPEFIGAGAAVAGTGVGDALPRAVAIPITLRTGGAGKSFRGRVFISGLIETQNDSGAGIVAGAQTAALAFLTTIVNALTAQSLTLAVLSPALPTRTNASGETLAAKPAFATAVTARLIRNAYWGSQRRRTNRP